MPRVGNCSDIRNHIQGATDDEYAIRLHNKCNAVNVYCHNMAGADHQTSALEYLTLNKGPEENFAIYHRPRLTNYNSCSGSEIESPGQTENFWGHTRY